MVYKNNFDEVVNAWQWTEEIVDAWRWAEEKENEEPYSHYIELMEKGDTVNTGDWIIKTKEGEVYSISDPVFRFMFVWLGQRITKKSTFSGKLNTMTIPITNEQLEEILLSNKIPRKVIPALSIKEEEFLLTGMTPEEWNDMSSFMEEE